MSNNSPINPSDYTGNSIFSNNLPTSAQETQSLINSTIPAGSNLSNAGIINTDTAPAPSLENSPIAASQYTINSPLAGSSFVSPPLNSNSSSNGTQIPNTNSVQGSNAINNGSGTQTWKIPENPRTPNPLDNYNEYTYHTFLFLCENTETADIVNNQFNTASAFSSIPGTRQMQSTNSGNYMVITDSYKMSDIYITDIEYEMFVTARTGVNSINAVGTSIAMEIFEPKGCFLLSIFENALQTMGVQVYQASFLLKTVFVGYTDDQTPVQYISNIPGIQITFENIITTFTEIGSTYKFTGVIITALDPDSQTMNRYDAIAQGFSFNTNINNKAGTLGQVISKLETKLNKLSDDYYNCMISGMQKMGCTSGKYIKTQYKIIIPPEYEDYIVNQAVPNNTDSGTCTDGPIINSSADNTISSIIGTILHYCPEILAQKDHVNRITSSISSTQTSSTITFTVARVKGTPTRDKTSTSSSTTSTTPDFVFDYVYTGYNVDVLKFNMEMSLGINFFTVVPNNISNRSTSNGQGPQLVHKTGLAQHMVCPSSNVAISLFPGNSTLDQDMGHFPRPHDAVAYNMRMSYALTLDQSMANITIRGNPNLLGKSFDSFGGTSVTSAAFLTAEVNVKMPNYSLNDLGNDIAVENSSGSYAKRFWYQGEYAIMSVKNKFKDGEFTQDIQMMTWGSALTAASQANSSQTAPNTGTQGLSAIQNISNECDGIGGQNNTQSSCPMGSSSIPYNSGLSASAYQAIQNETIAQRISAYDSIINQASQKYGVPVPIIKGVISQESGGLNGLTSSSGAMGLMQLEPGTAAGLGVQDAWDPTQNIMGGTKLLSQLNQQFGGNWTATIASYNEGPGNYERYGISNSQTAAYVPAVLGYAKGYGWTG